MDPLGNRDTGYNASVSLCSFLHCGSHLEFLWKLIMLILGASDSGYNASVSLFRFLHCGSHLEFLINFDNVDFGC